MSALDIILAPSPVLYKKTDFIVEIDKVVRKLSGNMFDTMYLSIIKGHQIVRKYFFNNINYNFSILFSIFFILVFFYKERIPIS